VTCEGQPHFWVSADGEYQEEGQNPIEGRSRIWDKVCVIADVYCHACFTYFIFLDLK
jgi:hypothetical protein